MVNRISKNIAVGLLLLLPLLGARAGDATAGDRQEYAEEGSQKCLSCHDFGTDSPVHPMLDGPHGNISNSDTPMAQKGCEHCHGPSAAHAKKPTILKPGVSFGPRWTDSVATQSQACLQCHQSNIARGWLTGVHQREDLSCVTCHDLHVIDQAVLDPATQPGVCTVCHKVQDKGIHHLSREKPGNPACVTCHDPHADPSPVVKMLANRSEGCRSCHDFREMQKSPAVSNRAKQYHLSMAKKDRTCVDCHRGVAHSPPGSFPLPELGGLSSAEVRLFFPGKSDYEWVRGEHDGAQSFRQGRNCQQCHRGDQAEMGTKLAAQGQRASAGTELSFERKGGQLLVTISWRGSPDDRGVALMIDDGSDEEFSRGGCWASCHSDMPGMREDGGLGLGKYLSSARAQERRIGQPARFKSDAELAAMISAGHYVEMWRAELAGGGLKKVTTARVLAGVTPDNQSGVSAEASYADGRWTVTFAKPLKGSGKRIVPGKTYTLGYAVHGEGAEGAGHWVSLPMTFSLDNDDTDFTVN